MKANMLKAAALAVAVMMVFSVASATAGEGWGGKKGEAEMKKHFDKMSEELGLTGEQKATLEKHRAEMRPKMDALREKERATREQLKAELEKATPDKATLDAIVQELKDLAGEKVQLRIDGMLTMKKVLTPEQSAKMKSVMEEKRKEFKEKRGHKGEDGPPHDDM